MPIERAFILAAGKGTRMGEIGKSLPKVLWPLFESTLLGLQIEFLKSLGVSDITLNSHHLHDQMSDYIASHYPNVRLLHESELLDAGGGVHNYLKQTNNREKVFLMNSDQYLELEESDINSLEQKLYGARLCLLAMKNPGGFSGLKVSGDQLIEIADDQDPMYVGLSILDPLGLPPVSGVSKFFQTVANFQNEKVTVHQSRGSYIDFGTTEHYAQTCFELLKRIQTNKAKGEFFINHGIISVQKLNAQKNSYDCDQAGVLNFSGQPLQHTWPAGSVILKEGKHNSDQRSVVFGEIIAKY